MKYTLVIAAYDEEENIGPLTARLIATLDAIPGVVWELIYVVDGKDGTRAIVQSLAENRKEIRMIYNEAPSGLGKAFRTGFDAVPPDTDLVITMDADLNHQPEEIPRLVDAIHTRNADIVIGSRKVPGSLVEGAPMIKTAISNLVNVLIRKAIGMPVADQTSGYRVYRYQALRRITYETAGFAFVPEMLLQAQRLRLKMVEEPIHFIFRTKGVSKMEWVQTARSYLSMLATRWGKK